MEKIKSRKLLVLSMLISAFLLGGCCSRESCKSSCGDPLQSWNDGAAKQAIVNFVSEATKKGGDKFIPVADRIAVFDNDGTLWCEHPLYFEMIFSLEEAKKIIAAKPELAENSALKDINLSQNSEKGLEEAFALSHSGMSTDEFAKTTTAWLDTATHSRFKVKYTELIYQPMVELLQYLRDNQFKTYIVSGGSSAFIRQFSEKAYGIPAEQVIGSMQKAEFVQQGADYNMIYTPEVWLMNDRNEKPVGIEQIIGKKPVLAFGNSDGDLQMLQWTSTNTYPTLCLLLHHTDAEREYAYDSLSHIGALKAALIEGQSKAWTIVDMKNDFKTVFAFEKK